MSLFGEFLAPSRISVHAARLLLRDTGPHGRVDKTARLPLAFAGRAARVRVATLAWVHSVLRRHLVRRAYTPCIAVVSGILVLAGANGAAQESESHRIGLVRSIGELSRCDVIAVGSAKVRLGVSSRECARTGSVVLYCLTEGYSPPERTFFHAAGLGPLQISVVGTGTKPRPPESDGVVMRSGGGSFRVLHSRRLLFVNEVRCRDADDYLISLWTQGPSSSIVADAPLMVRDRAMHLPIAIVDDLGITSDRPHRVSRMTGRILTTPKGTPIAVASNWDGSEPFPVSDSDADLALPSSDFVEDEDLSLSRDATTGDFWVRDRNKWVGSFAFIVARLWVDDVPLEPIPFVRAAVDAEAALPTYSTNQYTDFGSPFRLSISLASGSFAIRRGSRITIQVLITPGGWRLNQQPRLATFTGFPASGDLTGRWPQPRASNKVTFEY
jgi:hypothetical protein